MHQKILVADVDPGFVKELKVYCNPSKTTVNYYSKSEDVLTHIGIDEPTLVFLSLDLPDVNDFIVFDILKRCSGKMSSSIFLLYSDNSENILSSVRKLKFTAEGYLKKPVSSSDLKEILKNNLESDSCSIPSDPITMTDVLDDDDIIELETESDPNDEIDILGDDIFVESSTLDSNEVSDPDTNTELKQMLLESDDSIPDIVETDIPDDSPFEIGFQDEKESISNDFKKEVKEKEAEFEKEKQALLEEMNMIKEREAKSDEEKKKLLRDIETSELKLKELDKERDEFRRKMDDLSSNYEKRIEELHIKYKNKMKKFEAILKQSLSEIEDD